MMVAMDSDTVHPPLRVRRQRGPRRESSDPATRLDAAMDTLQQRREWLILMDQRDLVALAMTRDVVSIDDTHGRDAAGVRGKYRGAVIRGLLRAGVLRPVGYAPSRVPSSHCRPVLQLTLADPEAARRWLAEHPEPTPGPVVQQTLPLGDDA